jgi:hypothetical protein
VRSSLSFVALLLLAAPAAAQPRPEDVPDMPRPAEITKRVNELLDGTPDETLEVAGVFKLVYKRLPLDVHAVAMQFGQTLTGRQAPRGMPLDNYVKQFEPTVQQTLDARLEDIGALEVFVPLKTKSKTIAAGTYRLGIALQNGRPAAYVLKTDALKARPVLIKLKVRRPSQDLAADAPLAFRSDTVEAKGKNPAGLELVSLLRGVEAFVGATVVPGAADEAQGSDEDEAADDDEKK